MGNLNVNLTLHILIKYANDNLHYCLSCPVLTVSMITLGTMVAITVWSRGKLRLFSVITGMITGYIVSYFAGLLPEAHLRQILAKPLLAAPDLSLLGWSFDASLILPFLIASLCTSVKTIGNLTTCQKINDADWKRPDMPSLKRGLLADGISASLSGLLGGMGQSTASSNIGLSLGTGATSRRIDVSEKNGEQRIILHFDH
jgi:xanthine permease XanP